MKVEKLAKTRSFVNLVWFAIFSRAVFYVISLGFSLLIKDYDTSASISIDPAVNTLDFAIKRFVGFLCKWDGIYFLRIATTGYDYENFHAFFPFGPLLARALAETLLRPLTYFASLQSSLLIASFFCNNVFFTATPPLLYLLGCQVLQSEKHAFLSSFLFIISPASVFMSVPFYTEAPFAFFSTCGLVLFMSNHHWYASICFAFCTCVRSNGTLMAGFFAYHALMTISRRYRSIKTCTITMLSSGIQCLVVIAPYVIFQAFSYVIYCKPIDTATLFEFPRPWCSKTPPFLYNFVQSQYWNVGVLKYFTVAQIPNFILAAPMIILSIAGITSYFSASPRRMFSFQVPQFGFKPQGVGLGYFSDQIAVFVYLWVFSFLVAFFIMHVQVMTRFLSSLPVIYWYMGHIVIRARDEGPRSIYAWALKGYLFWGLGYGVLGAALFSNFLPWT